MSTTSMLVKIGFVELEMFAGLGEINVKGVVV